MTKEKLGFPGGSVVKNVPANARDWDPSPGWGDPMEEEVAAHSTLSSVLAWGTPWTEEPDGLQSVGLQRVRQDLATEQQQRKKLNLTTKTWNVKDTCVYICNQKYYSETFINTRMGEMLGVWHSSPPSDTQLQDFLLHITIGPSVCSTIKEEVFGARKTPLTFLAH